MSRRLLIAGLTLAMVACQPGPDAFDGRWARYEFSEGSPVPGITHLVLALPGRETAADETAFWWRLEAFSGDRRRFSIDLLAGGLDFLHVGAPSVPVHRYLLTDGEGALFEYVDAASGRALLPKLGFFTHLTPRASSVDDPGLPLFEGGSWLGKPVHRVAGGTGASPADVGGARRLALDPEVLVGTSRSFRDDRSGRLYEPSPDWSRGGPDYEYVELDGDDYAAMIEAGFNIFRVPAEHLRWVRDEPVWFLVRGGFGARPDLLFRPNFFGAVMYMDEPAIRAMAFDGMFRHFRDPAKAAEVVVELTRGRYHGDGGYGRGHLQRLLARDGWDLGAMEISQPDYPVWETVASACWYEMEAGAAGWCMEGRYQPAWFARLMRDELGVDFPGDAEATIRFHQAFFTGAARRFGARWGVAIYGQMDPKAAGLLFPIAYEQGATYFWFWTSDHAHHVPFEEQLRHARALRRHVAAHPRRDPGDRVSVARVAIALPWGYLLDHYQLKRYTYHGETFPRGRMWWSREMEMTDENREGATYGQVLAAAATLAAELLRSGTAFDFVYLRRGEAAPAGYAEVRRVLESGEVVVEHP